MIYADVRRQGSASDGNVSQHSNFMRTLNKKKILYRQLNLHFGIRTWRVPFFSAADDALALSVNIIKPVGGLDMRGKRVKAFCGLGTCSLVRAVVTLNLLVRISLALIFYGRFILRWLHFLQTALRMQVKLGRIFIPLYFGSCHDCSSRCLTDEVFINTYTLPNIYLASHFQRQTRETEYFFAGSLQTVHKRGRNMFARCLTAAFADSFYRCEKAVGNLALPYRLTSLPCISQNPNWL
jgi:hypothetical protein